VQNINKDNDTKFIERHLLILLTVFFVSGYSALSYQVGWQRLLFAAIGVDIESITIIVSVFMFGLGVGALLGGVLADRSPRNIILFFAIAELGIGLFGIISPTLIPALGNALIGSSRATVAVAVYLFLAFPTLLMGATLPMLVEHVNQKIKNVGISIGQLYSINTLGATFGAFATGFILFQFLDIYQTIYIAAVANLLVSVISYGVLRK